MPEFVSTGGEHFTERFNKSSYLLAFIMEKANKEQAFLCKVKGADEHPIFLFDQFGTAGTVAATSAGGTGATGLGFNDFRNTQMNYLLDPSETTKILHWFVGVSPSIIRFFHQFPLNESRNVLPAEGGLDVLTNLGISGRLSPYNNPSIMSENWALKDKRPVYNVFNPSQYAQYVRMKFIPELLEVDWYTDVSDEVKDDFKRRARKIKLGGNHVVSAPAWIDWKGVEPEEVGL